LLAYNSYPYTLLFIGYLHQAVVERKWGNLKVKFGISGKCNLIKWGIVSVNALIMCLIKRLYHLALVFRVNTLSSHCMACISICLLLLLLMLVLKLLLVAYALNVIKYVCVWAILCIGFCLTALIWESLYSLTYRQMLFNWMKYSWCMHNK
jgi:hypothetical protein